MFFSKGFLFILLLVHLVLFTWGLAGFIEFYYKDVPWQLQNADFQPGMQFLHWLAILGGGLVFLYGYFQKWPKTPFAMTIVYAIMATLCAVQTLDLMTNENRYWAMLSEYLAYAAILYFLYHNNVSKAYFNNF